MFVTSQAFNDVWACSEPLMINNPLAGQWNWYQYPCKPAITVNLTYTGSQWSTVNSMNSNRKYLFNITTDADGTFTGMGHIYQNGYYQCDTPIKGLLNGPYTMTINYIASRCFSGSTQYMSLANCFLQSLKGCGNDEVPEEEDMLSMSNDNIF